MAAGRNNHASVRNIRNKSRLCTAATIPRRGWSLIPITATSRRPSSGPAPTCPIRHCRPHIPTLVSCWCGFIAMSFSVSNTIVDLYDGVVLLKQPNFKPGGGQTLVWNFPHLFLRVPSPLYCRFRQIFHFSPRGTTIKNMDRLPNINVLHFILTIMLVIVLYEWLLKIEWVKKFKIQVR